MQMIMDGTSLPSFSMLKRQRQRIGKVRIQMYVVEPASFCAAADNTY